MGNPVPCKVCHGEGGCFDAGHWYPCKWCKSAWNEQLPPINLPVSPSKGVLKVLNKRSGTDNK